MDWIRGELGWPAASAMGLLGMIEDPSLEPHPQPQNSLLRIFRLRPGLEWKFLPRRTWLGKNCSHCSFQDFHSLSKENQVSLVRTFLSESGSESKISRLGGWGWKHDPEWYLADPLSARYCPPSSDVRLHCLGRLGGGCINQRKFLWVRRGCQASQRKGLTSGEVRELPDKFGELPEKFGKLPRKLWIAVKFHTERTSGEVAENFRGSSGNFPGSPGASQKLGSGEPDSLPATRQICLQCKGVLDEAPQGAP